MTDLPSRDAVAVWLRDGGEVVDGHQLDAVLALYADDELKTNAKWREAIDYDRMRDYANDLGHPMSKGFLRDLVGIGIGETE